MAPAFTKGLLIPGTTCNIPQIGIGMYRLSPGQETFQAVLSAIKAGYRHIDTAAFYNNEADVGRAIHASKVPRSEIFITSKLWLSSWGLAEASQGIERSLENLDTPYIDLYLLHAPGEPSRRADTWTALENYKEKGVLKHIGVSNFGQKHLEKLFETARIRPCVNQIEVHPFLQRRDLVAFCHKNDIIVEAYSPLAKARKLHDQTVVGIALQHGVSPAQVLLAWSLAKGMVCLPKSAKPERQRENLAAAHVVLSDEDIKALDGLDEHFLTGWDPVENDPV